MPTLSGATKQISYSSSGYKVGQLIQIADNKPLSVFGVLSVPGHNPCSTIWIVIDAFGYREMQYPQASWVLTGR